MNVALNIFNRDQPTALLVGSGVPITQCDMWYVPPSWMGHPCLTHGSEASYITITLMNFGSLLLNSIKSASNATISLESVFHYVYHVVVIISVAHQISNFYLPGT